MWEEKGNQPKWQHREDKKEGGREGDGGESESEKGPEGSGS